MLFSPISALQRVLLPHPEAPTTPRLSPARSVRLMPSTAFSQTGDQGVPPTLCQQRIPSTLSTVSASGLEGVCPPSRARAEATNRLPTSERGWVSSCWLGPSSTFRPPSSIAMRSHQRAAMARSWLINSRALPISAQRPLSSAITCPATATSRLVVGSSAMSRGGSRAMARAMARRWRMPPLSSWGKARRRRAPMPTRSSSSSRCCRRQLSLLSGRWAFRVSSR